MKATAEVDVEKAAAELDLARGRDYLELFKVRINLLVLITTSVGFSLGASVQPRLPLLLHTLLGTALVAAASAALNQFLERDLDARMRRTADRPLPSGRMQPGEVLRLGMGLAAAGLAYLSIAVSLLTSLVAAVTLLSYVFVYTPLKRRTPLALIIGAVPGALPTLIGWTASQGTLDGAGWLLFLVLFLWQIPHFLAIGWLFRADFARADYPMLPVVDPTGRRTGRQAVLWSAALLPASLLPGLLGLAGSAYLLGALILGLLYLRASWRLARECSEAQARHLFRVSLLYLPVLLGLLVLDRGPW